MKRRAFLGFLGGAAVAGPAAAKAAADDLVLKQAGFPNGTSVAGAAPATLSPVSGDHSIIAKALAWLKKGNIPEWKKDELDQRADYERQFGLDPDLAALRSVSPGWKARKQRERNRDRVTSRSLRNLGRHIKQRAFEQETTKLFGEPIHWYD